MSRRVSIWKQAPFVRLFLPFMVGILSGWYLHPGFIIPALLGMAAALIPLLFRLVPASVQFRAAWVSGLALQALLLAVGMVLVYSRVAPNFTAWLGHHNRNYTALSVTVQEPLSATAQSYRTTATANFVCHQLRCMPVIGRVLLYFPKDSTLSLQRGDEILFSRQVELIRNSGNPGAFDYRRYTAFNDIYFQVYLNRGDFTVARRHGTSWLSGLLQSARDRIVAILRCYIHGERERGLAEALLIGYKEDLDKNLLQSYANTGVVHIIAISGLHLALVYWILNLFLSPLRKKKAFKWPAAFMIITCLWLFSILSGSSPSVLRSAVMFTCVVIGQNLYRPASIYNTLAASAFLLLCYNPFWLWDAGFQLSYAAVLSIVIFMRPIYQLLYFKNKIADMTWNLVAVTLSAQVLTTPVAIYYFHKFPVFFLIGNMAAVPLSSIVLLGELLLSAIAFFPAAADLVGKAVSALIWLMNSCVTTVEAMPYSTWNGLQISFVQLLLLYIALGGVALWMLHNIKWAVYASLAALLAFVSLRTISFYQCSQQQKMIVYNVSRSTAIDFIEGRNFAYFGDSAVQTNAALSNFFLVPSRVQHRVSSANPLRTMHASNNLLLFGNKVILLVDENIKSQPATGRLNADIAIISRSARVNLPFLLSVTEFPQIVIDSSVPTWKSLKWKQECAAAGIKCHSTAADGAFVITFN